METHFLDTKYQYNIWASHFKLQIIFLHFSTESFQDAFLGTFSSELEATKSQFLCTKFLKSKLILKSCNHLPSHD
ncbi:hypothetical protein Y1Q_0015424 [Alligator mississippiensis]|uniref:Uncharacterized protein n=1 Tax=Alligator mississippiensis TaxID=8496 RepID=A0A151NCU5_ALLMI|nr:hypothetical protein Y1Q_0015424 [Alligator mississippiensis]